jgi:hypothetical protein
MINTILIPEHWSNICNIIRPIALNHIFPYIKSKRVRSGVLSELFETQSAQYFNSIGISTKSCDNDSEPDLLFTEMEESCEIKVTSSSKREWMGGKYSKRSSEYILVSWEYKETFDTLFGTEPESLKFSVINVFIDQSEWDTLGDNYYATKITSKMLDNKEIKVLVESS